MKPFFKYFLCSIILFSIGTQAQNERKYSGLFYYKNSRNSGLNLKDSVKTIYFKFNKPKESLSSSEISHAILFNDVRMSSVVYFDEFQRMKFTVDDILGYDYLSFNQKKSNEYEYSGEKDRQEKSKYKSALKHYFPVWDCNLQLYLNHSLAPSETYTFEEDGKIWYNYLGYIYIYIYDQKGRISETKEYNVSRSGKATRNKKFKKEDLYTRKLFSYNDIGQVVNQKIIAGSDAKSGDDSYFDMGVDCGFCDDLQMQYTYDDLGRITKVILYGCSKIKAKEEYIYHPTKDYVETVKYYVTGAARISNRTQNFIKTFNEQGDIIKTEFIPDNPTEVMSIKAYYYSYEYDSHNNWIKCNIYMEGTNEGEPTLVAERKIEYYN